MARLLILSGFWPTRSNPISGIFAVEQISALVSLGHSVVLVLMQTIGHKESFLSAECLGLDPIKVQVAELRLFRLPERMSKSRLTYRSNILMAGASIRRFVRRLKQRQGFDGAIVHGLRYAGLSVDAWSDEIDGNVICILHGVEPFYDSSLLKLYTRRFLRYHFHDNARLVIVGKYLKDHAEDLGFRFSQTTRVPNGTELPPRDSVSPIALTPGRTVNICSVSNLIKVKGIEDTLAALKITTSLGFQDWKYTIVGDGPERMNLMHLVDELGLSGRVHFLGRLSRSETLREISACDLFCLPSWGEAFGIVYLEAMSRMRPVIGCQNCGPADFTTHDYDGLLVPPKSPESISQELLRLWQAPDSLRRIGINGRNTAETYSWINNAQALTSLLELTDVSAGASAQ